MPVSLAYNFLINADAPIDSRMVATDSSARSAIQFKYAGMKVFQLDDAKTYVYGTDSVWRVDGGNLNSPDQVGGIYGGSGSIPDNIGVYLGTLSNVLSDRTNVLSYFSDNESTLDKSSIDQYHYRRTVSNNYDTMGYMIDNILKPYGGQSIQGGYINFNGQDYGAYKAANYGTLNLGTRRTDDETQKGDKIIISPKNFVTINPTGKAYSKPFTFQTDTVNNYSYFSFNSNLDLLLEYYEELTQSVRFKYGANDFALQRRHETSNGYEDLMYFDITDLTSTTSLIKFQIDNSAKDWDNTATRDVKLRTIDDFIRNSEHRFTKIHSLNHIKEDNATTKARIINNILYVTPFGNSFDLTISAATFFDQIKLYRSSSNNSDLPAGTFITVRFINADKTKPGYIKVKTASNSSKIYSDFNDTIFSSGGSNTEILTIINDNSILRPDIITFRSRGGGEFDIVNINRFRKLVERNWFNFGASTKEILRMSTISVLTDHSSEPGVFQNISTSVVDTSFGDGYYPNKYSSSGSLRLSSNTNGFKLSISVDGNRIVFIQGFFRITCGSLTAEAGSGTSLKQFFYNRLSDKKPNIFKVGDISNPNYQPFLESVWTPVQCFAQDNTNGNWIYTLSNVMLMINRLGEVYLQFNAQVMNGSANVSQSSVDPIIDVWVPPFSYVAATGSYVAGGREGV